MNIQEMPTCITDYPDDLSGKRVIVRAGLNVPIVDGLIDDNFRIQKFLPTLNYLQEKGAIIIIVSHLGREIEDTLEPVSDYLSDYVENLIFYKDFFKSYETDSFTSNIKTLFLDLDNAENGDVFLLDNIRQTPLEKKNDTKLARVIAEMGDIYIHDAFPVAHRKHTSTYGVPSLFSKDNKYSGITFHMEQIMLNKAMKPISPSVFILGGAKFETKLPLIQSFLPLYDYVMVGGALANNLIKLAGHEVGTSLIEELTIEQENSLKSVLNNKKFILPEFVTCETGDGMRIDKKLDKIIATDNILDISPETIHTHKDIFISANTFLWNGPLGYYEGGYTDGSETLAKLVGGIDGSSIAGGGDTISAIYKTNQQDNFTFLSSAGGAMITYLSKGSLPGIDILLS